VIPSEPVGMSDRTLFWGETTEGARYQSGDSDPEGGDFIVVKNTDNETVLLQWNQTATEWEFAGTVDMGGNDLTNAGLVSGVDGSFDTLEAEKVDTRGGYEEVTSSRSAGTDEVNNTGSDLDVIVTVEADLDDIINLTFRIDGDAVDRALIRADVNSSRQSVSATVPNGSTYTINSPNDGEITLWVEQQ